MEIFKLNGQNLIQKDLVADTQGQRASQTPLASIQKQQNSANVVQEQGSKEGLAEMTRILNEQMDFLNINVRFKFNDAIGAMYVSVTERTTGKEIRQIPTEEAMKLTENFRDAISLIFNKEI